MKKNRFSGVSVGGASILVIFAVLCLAIFGVLSVSSAYADLRLSLKAEEGIKAYYRADSDAQALLAQIDGVLGQMKTGDNAATGLPDSTKLAAALAPLSENIQVVSTAGHTKVIFQVPVNQLQSLQGELSLKSSGSSRYQVDAYKVVRVAEETYETPLELWHGETVE